MEASYYSSRSTREMAPQTPSLLPEPATSHEWEPPTVLSSRYLEEKEGWCPQDEVLQGTLIDRTSVVLSRA